MHWRLHTDRDPCFKVSHLRYAARPYIQYQITVKLLGSFRLAAGRRHLHRPCIFTEQIPETVPKSLYHSCASELTRQGISLIVSSTMYSIFIQLSLEHGVWYLRILVNFIEEPRRTRALALHILGKPDYGSISRCRSSRRLALVSRPVTSFRRKHREPEFPSRCTASTFLSRLNNFLQ